MDRRTFLKTSAAVGALSTARGAMAAKPEATKSGPETVLKGTLVPDTGWTVWLDTQAKWEDDDIFLPTEFELSKLEVRPPTGGWQALYAQKPGKECAVVPLPATVEQYFWGTNGSRPYTPEEYRYAATDAVPQNGAYEGVSWWTRSLEIPASMQGKRILLHIRGARMRAEVFLNEKLVGYSIMEELPLRCDLTEAAKPGGKNMLSVRITNPGGRYDWVDGGTITWGKVKFMRSHGFGGLDRGMEIEAAPMGGHIEDAWVLNTPEGRTVTAFAKFEGKVTSTEFEVLDPRTGNVVAKAAGEGVKLAADPQAPAMQAKLSYPKAQLWDLHTPVMYHVRVTAKSTDGAQHVRVVPFGFRWFAPEGLGTNALFRMNGRRFKIYTSISWGYWGHNALFPTLELAEREVVQAKKLGLNCLNFHRNVGKEDVFRVHDRLGLLRYMEPGGGKLAMGKIPAKADTNTPDLIMAKPKDFADLFSQRFMLAKCRYMVRAFRSHPSLIEYALQNEIGADLKNPDTFRPLEIMHEEDPSRMVVLNDGFVARGAAQAWYEPYNEDIHRSDKEEWGGWWNNHQGSGDQWYDEFYKSAQKFTYNEPLKKVLVEFGEMEGCAVADNHSLMVHQLENKEFGGTGHSYDLTDHREILTSYVKFFRRWGFEKAFPTTDKLFRSLGDKCYESWQQYMENARICDEIDFAAISGWESTAIENHSGIVDNLRNFKGDPEYIASSLRPIRLVAKQHNLNYAVGESATVDLFLLNDTGASLAEVKAAKKVKLTVVSPTGKRKVVGEYDVPANVADQFSYLLAGDVQTPAFEEEGIHKLVFEAPLTTGAAFTRDLWVANTKLGFKKPVRVGVSSLLSPTRKQLEAIAGVTVEEFKAGETYDLLVASGVQVGSKFDRQIGDETGLEAQAKKGDLHEKEPLGHIDEAVLKAVRSGTPLLAVVPDDYLADGVAKQLATMGAFTYTSQVGDTRAPWMGNWLFVREHATFAGMPVDRALGVHYQAHGKLSNGLMIERAAGASDPVVIMGYSRDHDREVGAASFLCNVGKTPVMVHRAPAFAAPLQMRWMANTVAYLTGQTLR
ncbi:MAG: glycoside hydrolase [Acidobacteriaceae bacterium]|nr:glycoside hydrolase [Acidobacteriaceae bacterium]